MEVISDNGTLGAVLYKPGKSNLFGGIEANAPSLLMLKKEKVGMRLSVSDPTQKLTEIQLKIKGNYQADHSKIIKGQTILNISLPQKGEAGKTVSVLMKKL